MDTFNEQQLSMCETNELVNYIAELRVEIDELEKEKEELYDEDGIECSLTYRELDEEHDELKEKWQKLKEENEKMILDAKFTTWRQVCCEHNIQYSLDDEIAFLREETDSPDLIKIVFDKLYPNQYVFEMGRGTYRDYDEELDEQ